ncbi:MAG TPA: regulatory protein RecX [Steroidobacteraceae bacterium]|nr:regulatory protein RecX [Steroidobacteraceae bacterium]
MALRLPKVKDAAERADPETARTAAVALLARRDLSSGMLRERLRARGFTAEAAEAVVDALGREGVIDDARYAQNYVMYHSGRGQGPLRIGAELRKHGVAAALIDRALAQGTDWLALARKVRSAKFGPAAPRSWAQRARQARFLQYRGFSADHIRAATGADAELE